MGYCERVYEWREMKLMRANTHIHDSSSQASWYELYSLGYVIYTLGKSLDHMTALCVKKTLEVCRALGVHPCFTNHCFKMTLEQYQNICYVANNSDYECLAGFELTWLDNNHMNLYGSLELITTNPDNSAPGIKVVKTLEEFLNWLDKTPDSVVVCLNHPLYNQRNFDNFKKLRNHPKIKLMEVNSKLPLYKGIKENLPYYIQALRVGLRVAPVIGEDNFGIPGPTTRTRHTGLWVHGRGRGVMLEALGRRRVFASEDSNISIRFSAKAHSENVWRLMGSEIIGGYEAIDIKTDIEDIDESLGTIEIVEVKKDSVDVRETIDTLEKKYIKESSYSLSSNTICFFVMVKQADNEWTISAPIWINGKDKVQTFSVVSTYPKNGAKDIGSHEKIIIEFDSDIEKLNKEKLKEHIKIIEKITFRNKKSITENKLFNVDVVEGNKIVISSTWLLSPPFGDLATTEITIKKELKNICGYNLSEDFILRFNTVR